MLTAKKTSCDTSAIHAENRASHFQRPSDDMSDLPAKVLVGHSGSTDLSGGGANPPFSRSLGDWFVYQTEFYSDDLAQRSITDLGFDTFVPREEVRRGDKRLIVPLFAGYGFVRFDRASHRWRTITTARGVQRLLGISSERPTPVRDGAIDRLRGMLNEVGVLELPSEALIAAGCRVEIVRGAFQGHAGTVASAKTKRLAVLFDLFGSQRQVWISRKDVVAAR